MTEIEPTDSSTGRPRFLVHAIVALQATIGAAVALVLGATTLSPSLLSASGHQAARGRSRVAAPPAHSNFSDRFTPSGGVERRGE
jgi:hypothetical protein